MLRGILVVVLVICLVAGGYWLYKQNYQNGALGSGDVNPRSAPTSDAKERADAANADIDGNTRDPQATTTYDQNAAPPQGAGGASNQPPDNKKAAIASGSGTVMTGGNMTTATGAAPTAPLPVSDTIAPNPPNGVVFAGTGTYTWYRQGNLTWRVNSNSGAACIAFATMEEWQKPIVYTHGCGRTI